ncbi:MAG TPA: sugar transferase [Gemmataceae bacterium]|nr:sugar transferase [Gemmataceae bacterium]
MAAETECPEKVQVAQGPPILSTPTIRKTRRILIPPTPAAAERRETALRPAIFRPPYKPIYASVKGVAEFLFAALLLVLAAPVLAVVALAVKLTSRGPVLYTQVRVGKGGRPFTLYKIRSMVHDCEKASGVQWSRPGDPRVTRVGAFLRKTHLDELPQLWNVLRGDMSLVGPRPERPEFTPALERAIPHYRDRIAVRPGVTGLAQVQLPPDTDLASVRLKLIYDIYYIHNRGLWMDLRLVACTAVHMLGVPYAVLRSLFGMPGPDAVNAAYQEHSLPRAQIQA